MAQRKASIEIGNRMVSELLRMFPNKKDKDICKMLGGDRRLLWEWRNTRTPSALWLQRFAHLGGDVMYVLTGNRYALVKTVMVHSMGGTRRMKWNGETLEEES